MKYTLHIVLCVFIPTCIFVSCTKKSDVIYTSVPVTKLAQAISDAAPLCGAYKGHMISGKTYSVAAACNIFVDEGDTLIMDENVHLYMSPASSIIVKGIFISLGSIDNPNWITVKGMIKTDDPETPASSDSAYISQRVWCGINCDTSCSLLVLKWTHIEYTGGNFAGTPPLTSLSGKSHSILFQNPNGYFVMEDSWLYGSTDELRVTCGKICLMRNTLEKIGISGGEGLDVKHGTIGDMAYNLIIGSATNGTKASDAGTYPGPQTNVNMYNNTYINCGYRRVAVGHGGSLDYEEGAKGLAYNNLIINCKYGLRVVNNIIADTAHLRYGNTYNYGDSLNIVDQFYPQSYITIPQASDIPLPSSYLPANYVLGQAYNAPSLVSTYNPMFVNFLLPAANGITDIAYAYGFNFRLRASSPAIGKGYTGFSPLAVVPVDAIYGASQITPPGKDIGCYQLDGTGNQH